jgi:TolA-binding protein
MDPDGEERWRLEGYLTKDEFNADLILGLARVAVMRKDWPEAERRYGEVAERFPNSKFAPEAVYWKAVSQYKATNDHTVLGQVAETLKQKYPDSLYAEKAIPWLH